MLLEILKTAKLKREQQGRETRREGEEVERRVDVERCEGGNREEQIEEGGRGEAERQRGQDMRNPGTKKKKQQKKARQRKQRAAREKSMESRRGRAGVEITERENLNTSIEENEACGVLPSVQDTAISSAEERNWEFTRGRLEEKLKKLMEEEEERREEMEKKEEEKVKAIVAAARVKSDKVIRKASADGEEKVRKLEELLQKTILDEEKKKEEVRRREDEKVRVEEATARATANENIERAAAISEEKVRMTISEHDAVLEALFEKQRLKEDEKPLAASRVSLVSPRPVPAPVLALPECPVS